jgi:hypothetical protein
MGEVGDMLDSFLKIVERQAATMGHAVSWETIGEWVAVGRCDLCRMTVNVAQTEGGFGQSHGQALDQRCPGKPPVDPSRSSAITR